MSKGASFDYKFGRKNNWRNWQWNQIKNRLIKQNKSPKEAIGLCLAGPQFIDKDVATRKGFVKNNIIAVDLSEDNITNIRNQKLLGINHNLISIVDNWNDPKLDYIVADFCCGFNDNIKNFANSLIRTNGLKGGCVISVNLYRGRDGYNERLKKEFDSMVKKHRGRLFYLYYFMSCHENISTDVRRKYLEMLEKYYYTESYETFETIVRTVMNNHNDPIFNSYRSISKQVYMDSVIFNAASYGKTQWRQKDINLRHSDKQVIRKIAATKAIRTMRMNGIL